MAFPVQDSPMRETAKDTWSVDLHCIALAWRKILVGWAGLSLGTRESRKLFFYFCFSFIFAFLLFFFFFFVFGTNERTGR